QQKHCYGDELEFSPIPYFAHL
ncbi:uncharacterized protein METZ01_LOCUS173603, partial [marine metagenome]